jgi:hypothetical protein
LRSRRSAPCRLSFAFLVPEACREETLVARLGELLSAARPLPFFTQFPQPTLQSLPFFAANAALEAVTSFALFPLDPLTALPTFPLSLTLLNWNRAGSELRHLAEAHCLRAQGRKDSHSSKRHTAKIASMHV